MEKIRIFTDGACSNNPGPGGWAAIFCFGDKHMALRGNEKQATNNRMELTAVVSALTKILKLHREAEWIIVSDSAYVINAITQGWLTKWQGNGWRTSKDEMVKNYDLWERCIILIEALKEANVQVSYNKVKGHAGNPLNELADKVAKEEAIKAAK